jgi:hypothetical protein
VTPVTNLRKPFAPSLNPKLRKYPFSSLDSTIDYKNIPGVILETWSV